MRGIFRAVLLACYIVACCQIGRSALPESEQAVFWTETFQPQPVLLLPVTFEGRMPSERDQIILDGIDKSSHFYLTKKLDDPKAIWLVDIHRANCREVLQWIQQGADHRRQLNKTEPSILSTWRIILMDWRDAGCDFRRCFGLMAASVGQSSLEYAGRQHFHGRNVSIGLYSDAVDPFGPLGEVRDYLEYAGVFETIHSPLRYPVRSDMSDLMEKLTTHEQNATRANRHRPITVSSFTDTQNREPNSNLRVAVSRTIRSMRNLTKFVGEVGAIGDHGRESPQEPYARKLLGSKIVVVAQRDRHEDHYRLMEAVVSGALVMTDPMHPLPLGFKDGENIVVYTSMNDLHKKILYYSTHQSKRLKVARAGFELANRCHRTKHVMERLLLAKSHVSRCSSRTSV